MQKFGENDGTTLSQEEAKTKKRALLEAFLSKTKVTKTSKFSKSNKKSSQSSVKDVIKTKKVQLGWKHFRDEDNTYVQVPLSKGGGTRTVDVPVDTTRSDLREISKDLFFPLGKSIFGTADEMLVDLSNFKDDKINETIQVGDSIMPFNITNYMEAHKIKNVRIYMRTKKICTDESDEELEHSVFCEDDDIEHSELRENSLLMGSSEGRKAIIEEQDREYQKSLEIDIKKTVDSAILEQEEKHKERLQNARKSRVLNEPSDDFISVKIRHPSLGLQSRRFPRNTKMLAVYDWAGSLCVEPAHFTLNDPLGNMLPPSSTLFDKSTLNMVESLEGTPSMSESDDEVQFLGFGRTIIERYF